LSDRKELSYIIVITGFLRNEERSRSVYWKLPGSNALINNIDFLIFVLGFTG
jgi:hypothetical protein